MPQMAPIGWLSLFILFTVMFTIVSYINYFIYYPNKPSSTTQSYNFNAMNWKW